MKKLLIGMVLFCVCVFAQPRYFTEKELSAYNGKDSHPSYIALHSIVYDVSDVPAWESGVCKGYGAGQDMTMYVEAVGGETIVSGAPIVGTLVQAMSTRSVSKAKNRKLAIKDNLVYDVTTPSMIAPVVGKLTDKN